MLKNTEYVIYAYGIAGTAIIVYAGSLFFRLKRIHRKMKALEDKQ